MANLHSIFDPQTYSEAKGTPEWEQAMEAEFQSLQKNHTWTLSDLPAGKRPISCKWVYKVKYKSHKTLDKYKAHLVAREFSQKEGIDYEETFAPTAKMSTIRLVLALATQFNWKVHQMDVKSAFLNGDLQEEIYMTEPPDLGLLHYCLGVEVWQTENNIFLSQSKYAKNLVDRFRMQDCKLATTPMERGLKLSTRSSSPLVDETLFRQLVGNLIYLTATRPDISFAVSYISRFMSAPKANHWIAAKRVLRYVSGTPDYAGYVFSLGSSVVTWTSKKQQAVALSSTKAEYRGAAKASCEAVWLRRMLADMHVSQAGPTPLFCDNQGVLKLAKNLVFHERTKHVETHCHYIRQLLEDGSIQLLYVPTKDQPTDILTKPLGPDKFVKFSGSLGIVN
eukprot:PITA_05139